MKRIFTINPKGRLKRSMIDLSHEYKTSLKMGWLYPVLCEPVIPSDGFRVKTEAFLRLAPMIAPVMDRINVYMHYFFVPNRLVWDEWEDFMTGGRNGTYTPTHPKINIGDSRKARVAKGSLADYFGLPVVNPATVMTSNFDVSALPFRAYTQIYNDYYIDKNLADEVDYYKGSGNHTDQQLDQIMTLRKRAWNKDYFTSALPWAQRGVAPQVPITGAFTPEYDNTATVVDDSGNQPSNGALSTVDGTLENAVAQQLNIRNLKSTQQLQEAGITIEDLRGTARLQEWLEKMARGGSRYVEQVLEFFNVKSSDARLQRAEYLGGGKQNVVISEVLNTAGISGAEELPQGNMSGHGISVGGNHAFTRKVFEEHGHIIGIMSILPRTSYTSQGIERHWQKFSKYDYFWKQFERLGEQAIVNEELYFGPTLGDNRATFGYTPRYAEYRYKCSKITGDMRDNLKFWHLARDFNARPNLNLNFIESDPDKRIFAVTDQSTDDIYVQLFHHVSALRPMSNYSAPKL